MTNRSNHGVFQRSLQHAHSDHANLRQEHRVSVWADLYLTVQEWIQRKEQMLKKKGGMMNKYSNTPCVKWWTVLFSLKVARVSDHECVCVEQSWGTCCIYQWKRRTGFKLPRHSGWHSALSLLPAIAELCVCARVCVCVCGKWRCGCVVSQGWILFLTRSGPDSEGAVWVHLSVFLTKHGCILL